MLTCGPLDLRQHLHPAALRAEVKLAEHYNEYIDLSKEFNSRYGKGQNSSASSSVSTCSSLSSSAASSAYASLSGNSAEANAVNQQFCYCCDYSFAYEPSFADYYSTAHLGPELQQSQYLVHNQQQNQNQNQYQQQQHQEQMIQQQISSGDEAELLVSQTVTSSHRQQQQPRHKAAPTSSGHMRQLESMLKCK